MTPCLIVIDLMNDCLSHLPGDEVDALLAATNALVGIARQADCPVIWVRQEFAADLSDAFPEMRAKQIRTAIAGTAGAQLDSRLDLAREDPVIVKKRYSAFYGTALDKTLEQLGAGEIIIAGVNTHACVRMTAIDAYQRDYPVMLASDCIASYDREHARVSLAYMDGKIARCMDNGALARHLAAGEN